MLKDIFHYLVSILFFLLMFVGVIFFITIVGFTLFLFVIFQPKTNIEFGQGLFDIHKQKKEIREDGNTKLV